MKINITKIGAGLLAVGLCLWSAQVFAQTTTTAVTTTKGAFSEYVPASETVVVKSESSTAPVRYVVSKQTTVVDETGAPVAIERISPGTPLSVQYSGTDDQRVISRIVVQRPTATTTTTAPVTTGAVVNDQQTTTTTTRPLTHKEKHAIKEAREHPEREAKEQAEKEKEAAEKDRDHD
jgi:hypothetical protein